MTEAASGAQTVSWSSGALGRIKHCTVVMPRRPPRAGDGHPTLYLLHGYGGNRDTWVGNTRLQALAERLQLTVVMPESGRRWLINDQRGNRYEDYLLGEVIPFAERRLGSSPQRHARAIAGFSMGGAAALMHALRHPSMFAAAASLGGAVEATTRVGDPYSAWRAEPGMLMPTEADHVRTWGPPGSQVRRQHDLFDLVGQLPPGTLPSLLLDVGLDDHERVLSGNRRLHHRLLEAGVAHHYQERRGGHTWGYVNDALPGMLAFVAERLCRSPSSALQ